MFFFQDHHYAAPFLDLVELVVIRFIIRDGRVVAVPPAEEFSALVIWLALFARKQRV